jgi:hypothetical protein
MSRSECNCGRCRMLRSFPGGVAAGGGRWGYEGALPRPKSLPPGMCFVLVDLDSRKGGGGGGDRAAAVETAERDIRRKQANPEADPSPQSAVAEGREDAAQEFGGAAVGWNRKPAARDALEKSARDAARKKRPLQKAVEEAMYAQGILSELLSELELRLEPLLRESSVDLNSCQMPIRSSDSVLGAQLECIARNELRATCRLSHLLQRLSI